VKLQLYTAQWWNFFDVFVTKLSICKVSNQSPSQSWEGKPIEMSWNK
jgi:hypothetical protein